MKSVQRVEGAFPSEADLDWLLNATFGRMKGGAEAWWKLNALHQGPKECARAILMVWEASRVKSDGVRRKVRQS